jgi:hypothetical protein
MASGSSVGGGSGSSNGVDDGYGSSNGVDDGYGSSNGVDFSCSLLLMTVGENTNLSP